MGLCENKDLFSALMKIFSMKLCVTWQRYAGQTSNRTFVPHTSAWPLKAQAEENVKVSFYQKVIELS